MHRLLALLVLLTGVACSRPGSSVEAPQYILFSAQTGDSAETNFTAALLDLQGKLSNATFPVVGKDRVLFGAHLLLNAL